MFRRWTEMTRPLHKRARALEAIAGVLFAPVWLIAANATALFIFALQVAEGAGRRAFFQWLVLDVAWSGAGALLVGLVLQSTCRLSVRWAESPYNPLCYDFGVRILCVGCGMFAVAARWFEGGVFVFSYATLVLFMFGLLEVIGFALRRLIWPVSAVELRSQTEQSFG